MGSSLHLSLSLSTGEHWPARKAAGRLAERAALQDGGARQSASQSFLFGVDIRMLV